MPSVLTVLLDIDMRTSVIYEPVIYVSADHCLPSQIRTGSQFELVRCNICYHHARRSDQEL